jgi:hypothetical protein
MGLSQFGPQTKKLVPDDATGLQPEGKVHMVVLTGSLSVKGGAAWGTGAGAT